MRTPSPRPAKGASGGWWHFVEGVVPLRPQELPAAPVAAVTTEKADPDRLDRVYRALLSDPDCALSSKHHADLLRRGLSPEAIKRNAYGTLPAGHRSEIARRLAERFDLAGVPGFYLNANRHGEYLTLAGSPGLLIPYRDHQGRIVALQIRLDTPREDGTRYLWLSSNGRRGGTSPGAPVHCSLSGNRTGSVYLCESALNADVIADRLGTCALGLAGIHPGQARPAVEALAPFGRGRVILAPDADLRTNRNVLRGWVAVGSALVGAGYRVEVASWPTTLHGKPKGPDEALVAGAPWSVVPWELWKGDPSPKVRRGASLVRPRPADADHFAEPDALPMTEAEQALRERIAQLLRDRPKGVNVLGATLGLGKTRETVQAVTNLDRAGWPTVPIRGKDEERPLRLAFLAPTLELAGDVGAQLAKQGTPFVFMAGRSPESCQRFAEVRRLGSHRHSPARELCNDVQDCPNAGDCPYLQAREDARNAAIVVGAHDVILANPGDAASFDVIVIDEGLSSETMMPSFVADSARVGAWLEGMDQWELDEDDRHRLLARVLARALAGGTRAAGAYPPQAHALTRLRQVCQETLGVPLEDLVGECVEKTPPTGGRYPWESPWRVRTMQGSLLHGEGRMPIRGFWDLLQALAAELGPDAQDRTDSRLWLRWEYPEGTRTGDPVPVQLLVFRPSEALKVLRRKTTLWLDATPPRWTLDHLFGKAVRYHEIRAKENLHVVQLVSALHPTDRVREAVRERLRKEFPGAAGVMTRKRLRTEDGAEDALTVGHFGRDHRGTNRFEDCQALAIEGHYSPPPNEVECFVQAVRFDRPPAEDAPEYAPFVGRCTEGAVPGAGEGADPDVVCWALDQWGADVRQAVGRLRACRAEKPVLVVLECRVPVPGLPVDQVTTARAWLGWKPYSEERKRGVVEANIRRAQEADARLLQAAEEFRTRHGRLPSADALARLAGASKGNSCRVLRDLREVSSRPVQAVEVEVLSVAQQPVPPRMNIQPAPQRDSLPPPETPTWTPAALLPALWELTHGVKPPTRHGATAPRGRAAGVELMTA